MKISSIPKGKREPSDWTWGEVSGPNPGGGVQERFGEYQGDPGFAKQKI